MVPPTWPLPARHEQRLRELARVLALGGAWRFLHGPVVAASDADYPEPWDQTRTALAKVVGRTLWHAHLDSDAVLEDARHPQARRRQYLYATRLELARAEASRIELVVTAIGNDDVAGIVAHEIGRAYVAQLDAGDHPFRTVDGGLPDAATGSLATIALGLGVVAANAAHHDRSAGETVGRTAYHEHEIGQAGGLDWRELAFLLAVQATVRDDVLPALSTLRPSQAAEVEAWRAVLDDHEAELVDLLALGGDDPHPAPTRAAAPREVAVHATYDEGDLDRPNLGQPVFRYPERRTAWHGLLGFLGGFAGTMAAALLLGPSLLAVVPLVGGTVGGMAYGRRQRFHRCATCRGFVTTSATECDACGGRIAGDIDNPNDRLDAEEALEARERGRERGD